jgi:hypothetical protein
MLLASDDGDSNEENMLLLLADEEQGIDDEAAGAIMDHEIRRAKRATPPLHGLLIARLLLCKWGGGLKLL